MNTPTLEELIKENETLRADYKQALEEVQRAKHHIHSPAVAKHLDAVLSTPSAIATMKGDQ